MENLTNNKKKKMVIHCASGIKNSGDEAILQALIFRYSKNFDIFVISLDAEYTRKIHPTVNVYDNGAKECSKLVSTCDVFILGGGGLLQDETTIFNLFRWLKYLKIAIKAHRFTMLYANSIGPLNYKISRRSVATILKKVNLITLRDELSLHLLNQIGVNKNVYVTGDPVFSLDYVYEETYYKQLAERIGLPPKYICVSVRHWYDTIPFIPVSICSKFGIRLRKDVCRYKRYINELSRITSYCNSELGLPVVFVSFLHNRDARVAMDVISQCDSSQNICINDFQLSSYDIMHIIKSSRLLLGMRLHSLIYAIKCEKPFIGISYSSKVEGILKKYGLQNCMMDVDTFDVNLFAEMYRRVNIEMSSDTIKQVKCIAQKEEFENERLFEDYYAEFR